MRCDFSRRGQQNNPDKRESSSGKDIPARGLRARRTKPWDRGEKRHQHYDESSDEGAFGWSGADESRRLELVSDSQAQTYQTPAAN